MNETNARTPPPAIPLPEERADTANDFEYPQREAAFFYGLFLRGHHPDELRNDIRVPAAVLAKWNKEMDRSPDARAHLDRVLEYRRNVLAIFESLLRHESRTQRIQ